MKLLVNQAVYIDTDVELCAGHLSAVNSSVVSYTLKGRFLNRNTFHYYKSILFNFGTIFISHFFSQFHNLGYKKFLIFSEANKNMLYFHKKKFAHFSVRLHWIYLYIQPPCLIIWDNMFFVVIFSFLVCFLFKFKFFFNLNLKHTKKKSGQKTYCVA